jgi:hypothetical protein
MTEMQLTLPPGYVVSIKFDPAATLPTMTVCGPTGAGAGSSSSAPSSAAAIVWAPEVEAMFQRYEKNGKTSKWPHREVAAEIQAAGFEPHAPATGHKPYVRWTYDGSSSSVTVYQEGSGITVDSHPLLPYVATLPGAITPAGKHPKIKWQFKTSITEALNVVSKVREFADA